MAEKTQHMSMEQKRRLTAERLGLEFEQVPREVAIIMDGNGRWAQRQGLPRAEGHRQGGRTVERVAQGCVDLGMKSLTLYSFSTENWKRPKAEVEALMHLYTQYLEGIRPMLMKNDARLVHLGREHQLPGHVRKALDGTMELTADNKGMVLALALNYSGRAEVADTARKIGEKCAKGLLKPEEIDEKCFAEHLYIPDFPQPDLLVRTAGEMRVSNYLLWQIAYSEFHVTERLWPEFNMTDVEEAIRAYAGRERRFGALG